MIVDLTVVQDRPIGIRIGQGVQALRVSQAGQRIAATLVEKVEGAVAEEMFETFATVAQIVGECITATVQVARCFEDSAGSLSRRKMTALIIPRRRS